jgi:hypothetical protein
MTTHFETLWERCEQYHQDSKGDASFLMLINELVMKANLLNVIEQKTELSKEDSQAAKSRLIGEILLVLTHMSLKDNINVFTALDVALHQRISQRI